MLVVIVLGLAVLIIGLLIIALLICLLRWRKRRRYAASMEDPQLNQRKKTHYKEIGEGSNQSRLSEVSNQSNKTYDNMKLCFVREDREIFDVKELLGASAEVLGSGNFTSSYKAGLMNGSLMVVKRFRLMNNVGKEEFDKHMKRLGGLDHPCLLPLVAYYYRKEEKLLITDYVPYGSLEVCLHGMHVTVYLYLKHLEFLEHLNYFSKLSPVQLFEYC